MQNRYKASRLIPTDASVMDKFMKFSIDDRTSFYKSPNMHRTMKQPAEVDAVERFNEGTASTEDMNKIMSR